jgi:hypothetical protein
VEQREVLLWTFTGQDGGDESPDAVDVGGGRHVMGVAGCLLRRGEPFRPEAGYGVREGRIAGLPKRSPSQPPVGHDPPAVKEQDVGGLDIPADPLVRVRAAQPLADRHDEVSEGSCLCPQALRVIVCAAILRVRHDEPLRSWIGVQYRHDVRMVTVRAPHVDLAAHAAQGIVISAVELLHRDGAAGKPVRRAEHRSLATPLDWLRFHLVVRPPATREPLNAEPRPVLSHARWDATV